MWTRYYYFGYLVLGTYTIVYISQNCSYTPAKLFIAYLKIGKIQGIAGIMYQERHSRLKNGKIVGIQSFDKITRPTINVWHNAYTWTP